MKVWIDILTPKQVLLFGRLKKELESRGHSTLVTTRNYRETNQMLEFKGIDAEVVGRHGGGTLYGKLEASTERISSLSKLVKEEKPDLSLSLSSPEAARVSFGLQIPHVCWNDIPEAEAQAKLAVPLSSLLITPKVIPKEVWFKYGISEDKIIQYDALDPIAWLKDFKANPEILEKLGIDGEPLITFRAEECFASYLMHKTNVKKPYILNFVNAIMDKFDGNFVVVPRYHEQIKSIRKELHDSAIVPDESIDAQSLLYYSNVFIGGGGTMTLEAALLGTPTIACRPMETIYENYVIDKKLAYRARNVPHVVNLTDEILENNGTYKRKQNIKAKRLIESMEDPIEVASKAIESMI